MPGVDVAGGRGRGAPGRSWVVVAERAAELHAHAEVLRELARGVRLQLVVRSGPYDKDELAGTTGRYVLRTPPTRTTAARVARRARRVASRAVPSLAPEPSKVPFAAALAADERVVGLLGAADRVVTVGPRADADVPGLVAALRAGAAGTAEAAASHEGAPVTPLPGLLRDLVDEAVTALGDFPDPVSTPEGRRAVSALAAALARLPDGGEDPLGPTGRDEASRAVSVTASRRSDLAMRLLAQLRRWPASSDDRTAAVDRVNWAVAELTAEGTTREDVVALVAAAVPHLDEAVARGDAEAAARVLSPCLALLFHRELHADSDRSPLVDDPGSFLAPLRRSATWALLQTPVARSPREVDRRPADGRPSAVVLPGSYGRFSRPVVTALAEAATTRVLDTTARRLTVGMGVSEDMVSQRLHQALGLAWRPDYVMLEAMEAADAVLVDWADRSALLATMAVPDGVRLVLRIHSMDALSCYVHLLDWSRVDAVVFVSAHIRDVVLRGVGDAMADVPVHVVPNPVATAPFDAPKRSGAERTLAVVGWGQRVKDPVWALEVLARLRAADPTWRLRLIGADIAPGDIASANAYATRFRERLTAPDVVGSVDFVPYTDDVPDALRDVGFIVSASVRESAPVGLTEGAASGAVPVVRDWPLFASLSGARRQFPEEWVVADEQEAAQRVLAHGDHAAWQDASQRVREQVADRFGYDDVAVRLRDVVLGAS